MPKAYITKIDKATNGRLVMYLESVFVDDLGLEYSRTKYRRGYDAVNAEKLKALVGKEVKFEDTAVVFKDYTLPDDHESAGKVVQLAWITGNLKLV